MATLTLYNGDCLEVMRDISACSVDLIICDLPYGCLAGKPPEEGSYRNKQGQARGCAWDVKIDLEAFWREVKRIRRSDNTPCIHFCTTKFGYELIQSNPTEFRYDLVWDKQRGVSFLSANKMPMRSHEMIYVFSKVGAYYKRIDISGNFNSYAFKGTDKPPAFNGSKGLKVRTATENDGSKRCVLSVIKTPNKTLRKSAHPTEKPEDLYRWLIERYCPVGGTVLDPTFGSGNSVFTAVAMGRSAIGIEKDEGFFKKAEARNLS
jgi:site-specific DNA-methyltransferase (adenine-specific)